MSVDRPEVLLQMLDPELPEPSYAHPGDAGADLHHVAVGPVERLDEGVDGVVDVRTAEGADAADDRRARPGDARARG